MAKRQKHAGRRPPVQFDLRQVEQLANLGCTEADMAAVLGVSVDTIQQRKRSCDEFRGVIERGQASLRNSLRRLQVKKALEGNVTMLIWLGKQLLGQSDRHDIEHSGGDEPVKIIEVVRTPDFSHMSTEELERRIAELRERLQSQAEDASNPAETSGVR